MALAKIGSELEALNANVRRIDAKLAAMDTSVNPDALVRAMLAASRRIAWLATRAAVIASLRQTWQWGAGIAGGWLLFRFAPHVAEILKAVP